MIIPGVVGKPVFNKFLCIDIYFFMNHKYQLITQDNAVLTAAVSAATPIAAPVPNIVAEAAAAPAVSGPVVPTTVVQ